MPPPVVAVASGKGGVGKTSVAVGLARELVRQGVRVGLLDADLHGPDVPRMLGIRRDVKATSVTLTAAGGEPGAALEAVEVDGLEVASVGFLLGGDQGLTMAGPFAHLMLGRLLHQTAWGELDVLVVDLPPGTGEIQQGLLSLAPDVAALLVVTPAEVSHLDTGRAVAVLRQAKVPLLGAVENMAFLTCPGCGERTLLHVPAPADRTIWALGVQRLATVPYRSDAVVTGDDIGPAATAVRAHLDRPERTRPDSER
jgi:ATP-binding protein involved in chromosome partitioning